MKKIIKSIVSIVSMVSIVSIVSIVNVSCVDTVILPDDKTVDEDFWQTKSDVSMMVNKVYQAFASDAVMQRMIVWGDFRSDEFNYNASISGSIRNALEEISAAQIETTNTYSDWASIYSIINYANIVLKKAEGVMSIDPNYTEGDYLADRSQMLAMRALCYFYLVRVYRDIPYSADAYMMDSQEMNLAQSAPDYVLQQCINDLEEAKNDALESSAYNDWRAVGYVTKDAINAMLADIYLWRASVLHSDADYQKCIECCDLVIKSKDDHYVAPKFGSDDPSNTYHLFAYNEYYDEMFGQNGQGTNSHEKIFEIQFDGSNNSNTGLCAMYNKISSSSTVSYLTVPAHYAVINGTQNIFVQTYDRRLIESVYNATGTADEYDVRKYVTEYGISGTSKNPVKQKDLRDYTRYAQNWILYRLTDVLLMKAEALVALGDESEEDDSRSREAFALIKTVNDRAQHEDNKADSLKWNTYKDNLETLVLQERARELCFEGKRWFDLLRYNYRHLEGVDYSTILAVQSDEGRYTTGIYKEMLTLMAKKYSKGGGAVTAKMKKEGNLYMPILQSQIDVNPNLRQNPSYSESKNWSKN